MAVGYGGNSFSWIWKESSSADLITHDYLAPGRTSHFPETRLFENVGNPHKYRDRRGIRFPDHGGTGLDDLSVLLPHNINSIP